MKRPWRVLIHLTPGDDGWDVIVDNFESESQARDYAQSVGANPIPVEARGKFRVYPPHRIDYVEVRGPGEAIA